jgi:hypothetical protein
VRWNSHDGLSQRAEEFEPGPDSLRDLFRWPERAISALDKSEVDRIHDLLNNKAVFYSDYSGMDCYREALELGVAAFRKLHPEKAIPLEPFTFARACDWSSVPQQLLMAVSREVDGGRSCVFGDICSRLHPDA